ncbi:YdcF family protein [Mucilaginibacter sp. HMF5004]|uniref:YdcF family protein n=1 Tax=Mucilaginibacter rivuli TaxID=2857527 RepID=UPI001C5CFA32|nr:YdcF family protein [Mucilaginibacter rivuli]MBW4890641.1 YdcF family protein [Mucilaginibacter rivuli]
MYFFFSKILAFLISPFCWVLMLLITGLVLKNKKLKKSFLTGSVVTFLLFSIPLFLNQFANLWRYPFNRSFANKTYSCVIVLGGFSGPGGPDTGHFNASADRFIQGIRLFETRKASHILITSGNSSLMHQKDGFVEGDWVKGQLKQFNIPDSAVLIENKSKNTIENAAFTKLLLANSHLEPPYLLVTSDFHMRRAMATFKKAGLYVEPYPCNFLAGGRPSFSGLIPDVNTLPKWDLYIKEVVGCIALWFK